MEQKLRNEARGLLEKGRVDYIAGFEQGSLKFTTPLNVMCFLQRNPSIQKREKQAKGLVRR